MKICLTILNPSPAHFQAAISACAEINKSRQGAGLHGRVAVHMFSRIDAAVLAVSWKKSKLSAFTQRLLDGDKQPKTLVSLIEMSLGRSLKFESGRKLARGEAAEIRAKCDPDPTADLLARFPEAQKSDLVLARAPWRAAPWEEVQKLLDEARGLRAEGAEGSSPLLPVAPQLGVCSSVRIHGFTPELTFSVNGTGESYLLFRPEAHGFEFRMDSYGCYRLLKLTKKNVEEVPLLWVSHCQCGHVMDFDSADGRFEFEFHKGGASYGFRRNGNGKKRLSVTLCGF